MYIFRMKEKKNNKKTEIILKVIIEDLKYLV